MKYATVLALVSTAQADKRELMELPVFSGESFAQTNIIKSMLESTTLVAVGGVGEVTYGQCDDDMGVFTLDTDSTSNTPSVITKGSDLAFHLAGIVSDPVTIENIHVHVDWNSTPLYDEDHKNELKVDSELSTDLGWNVPAFAPGGTYAVKITGIDADNKTNMCVTADFSL